MSGVRGGEKSKQRTTVAGTRHDIDMLRRRPLRGCNQPDASPMAEQQQMPCSCEAPCPPPAQQRQRRKQPLQLGGVAGRKRGGGKQSRHHVVVGLHPQLLHLIKYLRAGRANSKPLRVRRP